jgi:hypothetical protein
MTTTDYYPATPRADVRASYEEYDLQGTRVAMIADPANEHAWIQSDVTTPVER